MAIEPCTPHCPAGDCAGCAFPPRRGSDDRRAQQQRAHEVQRRGERMFAFEPQRLEQLQEAFA